MAAADPDSADRVNCRPTEASKNSNVACGLPQATLLSRFVRWTGSAVPVGSTGVMVGILAAVCTNDTNSRGSWKSRGADRMFGGVNRICADLTRTSGR
jgi:hypothetical protein